MHVTQPLNLSTKQLSILGRLCAIQKPEVARELLSIYDIEPVEKDHALIAKYFQSFCSLHDIQPAEYKGALFKSQKVHVRRIFVAAMIRVYIPHLYKAPPGTVRLEYGFVQGLSVELRLKNTNVAKMIREVIIMEKVYEEFRANVDATTNLLTQPHE
jgi:hypothetical protein